MARTTPDTGYKVHFLSIDPGTINQGWVYGTFAFGETQCDVHVISMGCDDVIPRAYYENTPQTGKLPPFPDYGKLAQHVDNWIDRHFRETKLDVILIEQQPPIFHKGQSIVSMRLNVLQGIEQALLQIKFNAPSFTINAGHYKKVLKIATSSHSGNKQAAKEFANRVIFENKAPPSGFNDHMADALNQLFWYLLQQRKDRDYKIVFHFD